MKTSNVARRAARCLHLFSVALAPMIVAPLIMAPGLASAAPAAPTGGLAVAGSATIARTGAATLTIDQTSAAAIVDWSSFSVAKGEAVRFDNGSGATLNRVTGAGASDIDGLLTATGSIFLINPNGVIIGKSGLVHAGGSFVATTLGLGDSDFLEGRSLDFAGASTAEVVNLGHIGALGGNVSLIAAKVGNAGSISAAHGDAGLAAGYRVTLKDQDTDGSGLISVQLGGAATTIANTGRIAGAIVELRAQQGNIYALAGNNTGVVEATGVKAGQGKVWLVADGGALDVDGSVSAAGVHGGAGAVETSGSMVNVGSSVIDAGRGGTWLLDPADLTIHVALAQTISASLDAGTNVTEATSASGTGGTGDITLATAVKIAWTTDASLTFSAYDSVIDDGAIASTGGGAVTLRADNTGLGVGTVSFASTSKVTTGGAVDIYYNPADNPAGSLLEATSYKAPTSYAAHVAGGGTLSAYMLVNTVYDLQNMQNNLAGDYALGGDIDASATTGWNKGAGFTPIGQGEANPFTGVLEGGDHTISSLFIDLTTADPQTTPDNAHLDGFVGVFGLITTGSVRDLTLANVNVTGGNSMFVGALAGGSSGTLSNITTSGVVTTGDVASGLVGDAGGVVGTIGFSGSSLTDSTSSAKVSGGADSWAGGLLGFLGSDGVMSGSSATGAVQVGTNGFAGGAIGLLYGLYGPPSANVREPVTVSDSFATGSVTGGASTDVGGFVGLAEIGSITQSYATGAVSQTARAAKGANDWIGGFAGIIYEGMTVTQSFSTGTVTAINETASTGDTFAGGFAGDIDDGNGPNTTVSNSYTLSNIKVRVSGVALTGGFVGYLTGAVEDSYAAGALTGSTGGGGGFVGDINGGKATESYWNETASGLTNVSCCGTGTFTHVEGLTTTQLEDFLPAGFGASIWGIVKGKSLPYLLWYGQ